MRKLIQPLLAVLILSLMFTGAALASPTTGTLTLAPGLTAGATLTTSGGNSGTYTLTFTVSNTSGSKADINWFGLQLFNAGGSENFNLTSGTANGTAFNTLDGVASGSGSTWEAWSDTKGNNGSSACGSNTVKGWLCADTSALGSVTPFQIASNGTDTFVFTGSYSGTTPLATLDLMSDGCTVVGTCFLDGGSSNGNKWAVSSPMTGGGGVTTVPEPSSLMLIGAGVFGIGMLLLNLKGK